ncbi:murein L,D-transpeptidase [Nitriliruptoraceae bacterium ZYF776]|nr:murein L,D-transpeptidase [Profundirhabdus halotolerans]
MERRGHRDGSRRGPRARRPLATSLLTGGALVLAACSGTPEADTAAAQDDAPPAEATAAIDGVPDAEDLPPALTVSDAEVAAAHRAVDASTREVERLAEERAAREAAEREEQERIEAEERAEEERREAERAAEEAAEQLVDAQTRLIDLGYLLGNADGESGPRTTAAIMAFQAVNGLSVDGVLGPETVDVLAAPRAEPSLQGGPATRIEVDIDRQVLHLVEGGSRVVTLKVSTGRGGTFESAAGEVLRAETPVGTFTIDRRIQGEHQSSYGIGGMWDPMYFHGPWAIHGSPNVPAGPASSGCVRVTLADGRWLFDRVPNGTPVVLYGSRNTFVP